MSEKLYKASDVIGVLMNVCSDDDYLKATDWLSKIPSAVIRCKDCVHKYVCSMYGGSQFFCAYGEKGEEDE